MIARILEAPGDWLERVVWSRRQYIPFSRVFVARQFLRRMPGASIVDVGCGDGETIRLLDPEGLFRSTGLDIFRPYLERCRARGSHTFLVLGDVRSLPFVDRACDVAVCLEVCEHLDRDDAISLVQELERVARRMVVISTPVGRYDQGSRDGNPHWAHRSQWEPRDFVAMGYTVRGTGIRGLGGDSGLARRFRFLIPLHYAASFLASTVTYFVPVLAAHMVCCKLLSDDT